MSGFYNVHTKVLNPSKVLPQMTSGGFQPPFYFGGSSVPTYVGYDISVNPEGRGLTQPKLSKLKQETGVDRLDKILIPRHIPSIKK
jgi:hypothetical protein